MTERILLGDVGGTNVRFAMMTDGAFGPIEHMLVGAHAHFADALAAYLKNEGAAIRSAIFDVAGVVEGGRCALTNSPWIVDAGELRARFGFTNIRLVNDFEAVAWALPHLAHKDLRKVGGGEAKPDAPMLAIGPGTGLGVAAFVPRAEDDLVLHSEGGHTTLPGSSSREDAIIASLRQRFGHVSAERVLSGPGLENLYRAIVLLDALTAPERNATEITQAAVSGNCAVSRAALDMFCGLLGDVAGNFALSFGAQGGVFIGGGIIPHISDYLAASQFRPRFEAKGRMSPYVERIPVFLILQDDAAFVGLQALAARR